MEIVPPEARPGVTEGLGTGSVRLLFHARRLVEVVAYLMAARRSSREKGDGLSKARRLRLLVGTFVLALSVILTGCSGSGTSGTQERKEEDYEKMKMLKKQEEKEKEEKEKEEKSQTGIRTAIAPVVSHQELPGA